MNEPKMFGKADLHVHTSYSDAAHSVSELLEHVAQKTDLSVLAVTDHDTIAGAHVAQRLAEERAYPFEVIVGEEVTTREGHIVGLFLEEAVAPGLSAHETVEAILERGGLAFAPHPFFNFFKDRHRAKQRKMDGVGRLLPELPVDAIEVDNSTPGLGLANLRARLFNARHQLPALGSSDAHILQAVGKSYTDFPGRSAQDLKRAIAEGTVAPAAYRYAVPELFAYLRYADRRLRRGLYGGRYGRAGGSLLPEATR